MNTRKTYDILVVGELNIDLILDGINKAPEFGKEQRASEMTLTTGSSSAIFAVNSASLGSDVTFCGKTGIDNFGHYMIDSLSSRGVNTDSIIQDDKYKTGATVIFNYGNDRMMVTHPGAMEHMSVNEIPDHLFNESRHLHISAIFFQPELKRNLALLFKIAKEHGLSTSMDTQWDPEEKWEFDLEQILPNLDFFMPNEQELKHLTNSDDLMKALDDLSFFDTTFVVKKGVKGALMKQKENLSELPSFHVPGFVDAIGAGDSFNAGFIHAYLNGKNPVDCLEFGTLTAAVSTTAAGGTDAIKSYKQVVEQGSTFKKNEL